jgi:hypothetical protein
MQIIRGNTALFDEAASVAGPAALGTDRKEQAEVLKSIEEATGEREMQNSIKGTKARARKAYGQIGSTY